MAYPRTLNIVATCLLGLALSGCAALGGKDTAAGEKSEYSELYSGDMQVAHEAGETDITAQQAIVEGDRAFALGDHDRAMFQYVRALEIGGGEATTLNKIGTIHARLGNTQMAARAFALSLRFEPDNPVALEGLGLLLLGERRYDQARTHLEAALQAEPGRWRSHNALGMLDDLAGEHATAAGHYRQALEVPQESLAPHESALLWNNLGYSLYMTGDREGALQHLYAAIDKHPEFEKAWQNIGLVYSRKGEYDRALDAYLHVMDKPAAYNNIGFICMLEDRFDEAERFFRQAIKLSPTYYVKAHENLERLNRLRASAE